MNSIEKHVLRLIGENIDSPDVFADITPIRNSVNDAIQELCMVTGSYKRTYLLPLYNDRQFYRLGWEKDHFGYIVEAWDRTRGTRLIHTDLMALSEVDPWWMKLAGYPEYYMQIGSEFLAIYRKPSANGIVLELNCVCIPKAYTEDTDPVKVSEAYERAAAYLATSEFYASRGDAVRGKEYLEKYIDTAGLMTLRPEQAERQYQYQPTDKGKVN